jgi:hypothetical protein
VYHITATQESAHELLSVPFIQYYYGHPSIKIWLPALQTQQQNLHLQMIRFTDSVTTNGIRNHTKAQEIKTVKIPPMRKLPPWGEKKSHFQKDHQCSRNTT